jgi:hypothetical protein
MQTQIELIENHLKQYGSISSWEAIQKFRITRLSAIIYKLKKHNMIITKENKRSADGHKWYAEYTLND